MQQFKQCFIVPRAFSLSWCILEAWEGRAAALLENLIAVRISTTPKHRWQPGARARPRLSWQSKIIQGVAHLQATYQNFDSESTLI